MTIISRQLKNIMNGTSKRVEKFVFAHLRHTQNTSQLTGKLIPT